MPRKSRLDAPGLLHHIIGRGIERKKIFQDDTDRDDFLSRFQQILTDTKAVCVAWALIPNHFHLLLKTGSISISTVMKRLLTGYAVSYNQRHRRSGHLFQNRYKSILCQEDTYLLELVRYIHLNPMRAQVVDDLRSLDRYPYSGHSGILGRRKNDWQDIDYILKHFNSNPTIARRRYRAFVEEGIAQGKRPDLIGGGLIRSAGGWSAIKAIRKAKIYQKGDERILGSSDFVEQVLRDAEEKMEQKHLLNSSGFNLEKVSVRVSELLGMDNKEVWACGKHPERVKARSLLCYWAVREIGISQISLSQRLKISQSAVTQAVKRGEEIARLSKYCLIEK